VRSQGRPQVLEPLWHYAGRDWGFLGHMAILVANSCPLLETIGWRHAEHVLRNVVQGLTGWGKEHAEHADVRPYWANLKRVEKAVGRLPGDWEGGERNEGLTKDLVTLLQDGKGDEASDLAARQLADGKAQAGAVWDAVHLAAGELVLSVESRGGRPDGNALHANTSANALHYAFRASTLPDTRLLLTLQALAWMDLYRKSKQKKHTSPTDITALTGVRLPNRSEAAINAILATRTDKPHEAGRLAFAFVESYRPEPLLRGAAAAPHEVLR
jgi:hypothetical protein